MDGPAVKAMAITNTLNHNKSAVSSLTQGGAIGWLLLTFGGEQKKRKAIFSACEGTASISVCEALGPCTHGSSPHRAALAGSVNRSS
jgi:hypothetical protein